MIGGENSGDGLVNITPPTVAVPEPSTWAMMLIGFLGLGYELDAEGGDRGNARC